jgi:hypothetical protein
MKKRSKKEVGFDEITKVADEAIGEVENIVEAADKQLESTVAPIRKSIFKRFPVTFTLVVTFGFTATLTGIELMMLKYDFLRENPWVLLVLGVGTLIVTGTLYKKLG